MLYRPEDFEPLSEESWDEARIRAGIREIVDDTDGALRGPKSSGAPTTGIAGGRRAR
jgi:hypothetical protein